MTMLRYTLKRTNVLVALFTFVLGLGQQALVSANNPLGALAQGALVSGAIRGVSNGLSGVNYLGSVPGQVLGGIGVGLNPAVGVGLSPTVGVNVAPTVGVGLTPGVRVGVAPAIGVGVNPVVGVNTGLGLGVGNVAGGALGLGTNLGLDVGINAGINSATNAIAGTLSTLSNTAQSFAGGLTNVAENAIGGWVNGAANVVGAVTGGVGPVVGLAPGLSPIVGGGGGGGAASSSSSSAGGASSSSSSAAGGRGGMLGGAGGASSSSSSAGGASSSSSSAAGAGGYPGYGYPGGYGDFGYGGGYGMVGSPLLDGGMGGALGGPLGAGAGLAGAAGAAGVGLAGITMPYAAGPMGPPVGVGAAMAAAGAGAATAAGAAAATGVASSPIEAAAMMDPALMGRAALAADAYGNSEAESAIAGENMVEHGLNNARSAALASNAYRQAKLASARDRVNIAGTIQNTARISDAAIATHDAATKAEDSLLGSEVAVDSAGTVLDSDAAYIPPVTNSLLRSLPYGRLTLRNIVPRPLTYPSHLLPDVWLNGAPVNYMTLPLRTNLLSSPSPLGMAAPIPGSGGQVFYSNNGVLSNDLVLDPQSAYYLNPYAGQFGMSSLLPILANGQLQAMDEVEASHLTSLQQQAAAGPATYAGFGAFNPVPMLTGTVSDANLVPTTTMGTTYPIGSAFVIEPRDSFFQDYIDSSSSRQNFDERTQ